MLTPKHQVILYARSYLLNLLSEGWDWLETKDLDELVGKPLLVQIVRDISFGKVPIGPRNEGAGAISAFSLIHDLHEGSICYSGIGEIKLGNARGFIEQATLGRSLEQAEK